MKKKTILIVLVVLHVIALCFGVYAGFYTMFSKEAGIAMMVGAMCSLAAICASLMYLFYGYKKNASSYFRGFMIAYALSQLAGLVIAGQNAEETGLGILLVGAVYGPVLVMAIAENLGKKKSYILCGIAVLLQIGVLVGAVLTRGTAEVGGIFLMRAYMQLTLAVTMTLMTVAKYEDKAARKNAGAS